MAWVDDRIWCHPKFADLTPAAAWVYVKGLAYSTGFSTAGRLTPGQQTVIGATPKTKAELVTARLWEVNGDGVSVEIHDWLEHNGKRDERRERERERKRRARGTWASTGADGAQDNGAPE